MKQIKVSLPDDTVAAAHQARGAVPLSAWVRSLIHAAVQGEGHHGVPTPADEPVSPNHRHRYVKADHHPVSYAAGVPQYAYACSCGRTKVDA